MTENDKLLNHRPILNPYLATFAGVAAVSFSSLFVKLASAPPLIIATYRLLFTFLMLAPITVVFRLKDVKALSIREIILAAVSGIFLALHFVTWFISLDYTSVASSVVLVTTQPVFVVIGSYLFFREKISSKALVGGAMALAGSIYIGATDFQLGGTALLGDILALIAAVLMAAYLLIGRRLRSDVSLAAYTFVVYGFSSLTLILAAWTADAKFYPYPQQDWLIFFALAFVCTILGHTVFSWALRYIQTAIVSVSILGEPVGAIVWASLFLGEFPTLRQIIGGVVILTGLYIFIRSSEKNDRAGAT